MVVFNVGKLVCCSCSYKHSQLLHLLLFTQFLWTNFRTLFHDFFHPFNILYALYSRLFIYYYCRLLFLSFIFCIAIILRCACDIMSSVHCTVIVSHVFLFDCRCCYQTFIFLQQFDYLCDLR